MSDELLTVEQVARRLKLGKTKVYELMKRGDLRSITIDRRRLIPCEEVPAYIARKLGEAIHA
jgi:excisionase family DNA binding protein